MLTSNGAGADAPYAHEWDGEQYLVESADERVSRDREGGVFQVAARHLTWIPSQAGYLFENTLDGVLSHDWGNVGLWGRCSGCRSIAVGSHGVSCQRVCEAVPALLGFKVP